MEKAKNKRIFFNEKKFTVFFIMFCCICAVFLAILLPSDSAPDEHMKMDICKFISDYGELPNGGDERIRDEEWGTSYAFSPILSYIVSGGLIKLTSYFSQDLHTFYVAARLVSVLCYGIFLFFCIKIANKLFENRLYKWFFICLIAFLPQVVFIGSYINNDSFALMCISIIIYSWLEGMENKWKMKTCIMLAIAIGLCFLSYYNAYGFILTSALLFLVNNIQNKIPFKEILKKGIIITGIAFLICGWWFVRSWILYDGDFLGLSISDEYSNKYGVGLYKAGKRTSPMNLKQSLIYMLIRRKWIALTVKSTIAVFGYMDLFIDYRIYHIVSIIWAIGVFGYLYSLLKIKQFSKEKILLNVIIWINMFISLFLTLYYSYTSDFQPQGRYIMPCIIGFIYFVVTGYKTICDKFFSKNKFGIIIITIIDIFMLALLLFSFYNIYAAYYLT